MALMKKKSVKDKERDLASNGIMQQQEVKKEQIMITCQAKTSKARRSPKK